MKKDKPSLEEKTYSKDHRWEKRMAWVVGILFLLSLVPILYVGLYTHPTGDDYWYGKYVMCAWREQHSILACIKAACVTIQEFYYTWQGTWYSIFLFCFPPEIFVEGSYQFVPVIAICLLGGGIYLVLRQVLVKTLGLSKEIVNICFFVLFYQMLQYMPRITSGVYWFNGIMHYNANTFTAMVAIAMMVVYLREGKKYAFILATIATVLIGGGNYQAALMPVLFWGLLVLGSFFVVGETCSLKGRLKQMLHAKRVWHLGIGILLELVGVAISGTAPGNSLRSEEFEISLKWALQSIYYSIDRGIYLIRDDFYEKYPSMLIFAIFLALLLWYPMWKVQEKSKFRFPVPVLFILYMSAYYWAMYTPGIFSKADVSGGVHNTVQQIFLITSLMNTIYGIGYIQRVLRDHVAEEKLMASWWGPVAGGVRTSRVVLGVVLVGILFGGVIGWRGSTNQLCVELVQSNRAKVYDMVRREQIRILQDDGAKEARIPELFNYDCYPICHITATPSSDYPLNHDIQIYYGKDSVVAYDFREWFAEEGYEKLLEK